MTIPVVVRPRPIWQLKTRAAPGGGSQQRCRGRGGGGHMCAERWSEKAGEDGTPMPQIQARAFNPAPAWTSSCKPLQVKPSSNAPPSSSHHTPG